jgi:hypothetical protein
MRGTTILMMALGCSEGGGNMNSHADMALTTCTPSGPEVCDGKDNDCDNQVDNVTPATANKQQFVATQVLVPQMRTDYAIDLNGDGRLDNQLSALVATLKSQGTDAQGQIQFSITNGDQILLFDRQSGDTTYMTDACATAGVYTGNAQPMPNLMGGGSFTIDNNVPPGHFTGEIKSGTFQSVMPTEQKTAVTLTLDLVMFPGRVLKLPLVGAQIQIVRETATRISGEIHGAIRKDDVQANILPTFAAQVQEQVTTMPMAASSMQLLAFFDDGGLPDADHTCGATCANPDMTCAVAGDGNIDTCEVTSNGIVQGVVASDVQMFTEDGSTYMPNPANTHKDSLSLGVGFVAINANF